MKRFHATADTCSRCTIDDHELHCGDCFQLLVDQAWIDTRIELTTNRWILLIGSYWEPALHYDTYGARFYD